MSKLQVNLIALISAAAVTLYGQPAPKAAFLNPDLSP